MLVFAGLGNPGAKYAGHRHNIGFMAVERIAERHGFGPWRSRFQAEVAEGRLGTEKVLLVKPQTYMNDSGRSIGEIARYFKLGPEDVTVFHDELDLAPGRLRVRTGGGHAGHNGLRSIHAHLGEGYHRVRLGIGHPGDKSKVTGHVLHDFAAADRDWLEPLLDAIAAAAPKLAEGDASGFMNRVALDAPSSKPPPKPKKADRPEAVAPEPAGERAKPEASPSASPFDRLAGLFRRD